MNKKSRDTCENEHRICELVAALIDLTPQQRYAIADMVATLRQIKTTGSAYLPGYFWMPPGYEKPAE